MGIGDWIVLLLLAVWAALAVRYLLRVKNGCHGCKDCSQCAHKCREG